ncbi:MAG: sigma-70 family RNA polymerase sigma factor, partial [Planctomycetota bacterium]
YQDYAYGTAIGVLSDFELARDVVQEAFFRAFRDLAKLREPVKFGGWLQGIVRNVARHAARELARVREMADRLAQQREADGAAPSAAALAGEAEDRAMVRRALQRLGEANREAVSLYYVNGLSYGDIAGYLGVPETTVRGRLERGRAELRKELTMVTDAFKAEELPEDFAGRVRALLDSAAASDGRHADAVRELSALGAEAVDPLKTALADERRAVRLLAAQALCEIGDERSLMPLISFLFAPERPLPPMATQREKIDTKQVIRTPTARAIPQLREFLFKMARKGHGLCILILAGEADDPAVYERIVALFRDRAAHLGTRAASLETMCLVEPGRATDYIMEALGDEVFRCASGRAWWLAVRDGHVIPIDVCLTGFDRTATHTGRLEAARLVCRHGEQGAAVLAKLLREGTPDEKATASLVLHPEACPETFEALRDELVSGHREDKWTRMVGRMLVHRFVDRFLEWVDAAKPDLADNPGLMRAVAFAHVMTGRADRDDLLLCGQPEQQRTVLKELIAEQGPAVIPILRQVLRRARPSKPATTAFRWMRHFKEAAAPAALEMLVSEHWGERKAAVGLLRQWGKLTDAQREKALADSHIAVRHAAIGARHGEQTG